jgi:hypothetical protein
MWAKPWQKYSLPINKPAQDNGHSTIYIGNNDSKVLIVTPPESSFNNLSQQPPPQYNK